MSKREFPLNWRLSFQGTPSGSWGAIGFGGVSLPLSRPCGWLRVTSSSFHASDSPRDTWDPGRLWFRSSESGSLKLIESRPNEAQPAIAIFLRDCVAAVREISELGSVLGKLPEEFDWAWIDLCVGPVSPSNKVPAAARLWNASLERWSSWVRSADVGGGWPTPPEHLARP